MSDLPVSPRRTQRLTKGLIALGSSAILAIYAAGYARTQPIADQLARQQAAAVAPQARNAPTPTAVALVARAVQTMPPTPTATLTPAPTATVGSVVIVPLTTAPPRSPTSTPTVLAVPTGPLRDGTFIGNGTSRHGGMEVTVVIVDGKITAATVTQCQTRYPCSKVAELPAQVVARQSANVDAVSGATDSVQAYRSAVISALAQAR